MSKTNDKVRQDLAPDMSEENIQQALERIPYAKELGITSLLMGDELTLVLPYDDKIIGNPLLQALHGGAVGAFMETCAIVQLGLNAPGKPLPKPIGINIDYLRRGKAQTTYARATVAKQGSRVANVRVRAWQDSANTPISILHGHFMLAENE